MLHTFKYPQSIITPFVSFLEAQRPVNESDDLSTKWKSQGFQEKNIAFWPYFVSFRNGLKSASFSFDFLFGGSKTCQQR